MRKRIDFISPPFSGHLNPIIGMARTIKHEYDVRIISTKKVQHDIHNAGLAAIELAGDYDEKLEYIVNPPYAVGSNPIKLYRQFKHVMYLLKALRDELVLIYLDDKPDLMIIDFTLPVAGMLAEELEISWWTSHPAPCTIETADGPPAYLGGLLPGDSWLTQRRDDLGRMSVRAFKRLMFTIFKAPIKSLGFSRLYRKDNTERIYSPEYILGLGLPELEFVRQWPSSMNFIGPVLYTPPVDLKAPVFSENKKYILITLGTHLKWYKNDVAEHIKNIAQRMPELEFHFTDGSIKSTQYESIDNFNRFPFINYEQYIKYYDLVIHHGGTNIMYYCLQHAKPAIVHPVDYDQFDYAARLKVSGVALVAKKLNELEPKLNLALRMNSLIDESQKASEIIQKYRKKQKFIKLIQDKFNGVSSKSF